mgnify:CR=1 FL=1
MKFKKFNPTEISIKDTYQLLISGIAPRPIALVSSIDLNGVLNLAPFSFFNGFGANPPIVGFSPALSGKTGLPKDTLLNIEDTKEFTISIVTSEIVEQVSLSSCSYDRQVDEFVKSGLNKYDSKLIAPPGVKDSPFFMECKLHKIIDLGGKPASGNLILGEVVMFHVNESIIDSSDKIDPVKIDQVGRSGGPFYVKTKNSLFSINKPNAKGIGFDMLPKEVLKSELSGNNLAKLAGVSTIPKLVDFDVSKYNNIKDCILDVEKLLSKNEVNDAWQIILNWLSENE